MRIPALILLLCVILLSCGGPSGRLAEEIPKSYPDKIIADAYLYDTKIIRENKPTSLRLYLFKTDTLIALSGKAYLGKGALKGWLTEDTLKIYFPQSHEFVYDNITALFQSLSCGEVVPDVNLFWVFSYYPEEIFDTARVNLAKDEALEKYEISASGCEWRLELYYDRSKDKPYLRSFAFDDGNKTVIKSTLREYKPDQKVPGERFYLSIPGGSVKLSL